MDFVSELLGMTSWRTVISVVLRLTLVLFVAWLALRIIKTALNRLERSLIHRSVIEGEVPSEAEKRVETLARLLRQGLVGLIWLVALLTVLKEIGVDIAPILASAGIAGLAVGFGAQNLVRDVISGFFLILENQVRVGDVAVVNGTGGLVESVNFRTIVLRDLSGVVHVFPNGTITTLSNMTYDWSGYVMDIGVAYKEDTDRVTKVMADVAAELRKDSHFGPMILADMEIFGVDRFADSAVIIKARLKTKPIKQWEVGREYLRRLKKAFDHEAIEIPFPHRSVYFGEASAPFRFRVTPEKPMRETKSA